MLSRSQLLASILIPLALLAPASAVAPLGQIFPLGDSITHGETYSSGGGYRDKLDTDLKAGGYSFSFVGSMTDIPSAQLTADGQTHHEGHGGYRIDQIQDNLDANDGSGGNNGGFWLAGNNGTGRSPLTPSFVLLHIGTNDILQNFNNGAGGNDTSAMQTRLTSLVNQIIADRPTANVIVSTLIPINSSANAKVQNYNTAIKNTIVPNFISQGKHVSLVDQYANFVDGNGNIISAGFTDGVHPSQTYYDKMGDTWYAGIAAVAVPEPSSLVLLIIAAAGVCFYRWRRC